MLMPHDDGHFFFNDSATTALYPYGHTLSLHDALPILSCRRSSSTSIAGWPGALASSGSDGADRTAQRVWAVLGAGRAETLSSRTVTPDVSAASASRLLAVRSSCRGLRHSSTRSEEHTSELQSLMRISYAVFCLQKKKKNG